ncbi:unnamed protein product [Vicia faba]|uniref:Uncharacterized protein n=1 Tax=Vicia faba TaxID=3906 RepID=A0AAV1AVP7_VICFA|nr:unnamed protein product [Vicia faba]
MIVVCDMKAQTLVTDVGGDSYSKYGKELTEEYKDNTLVDPHGKNGKGVGEVVCYKCLHRGGTLLYCCGKKCGTRYHPSCLDLPLKFLPIGYWHCICCNEKKIKLGVHSVSKGVESIFDSQEVVSKDEVYHLVPVIEREYFVKYQGLAHAHNCWIPEKQMLVEAPKLLEKYKKKQQVVRWKKDWSIPQRLVLKRKIILSKQNADTFDGNDDNDSICQYEWLVKWTGLGYDHITWELDDASFMRSSKGMKLVENYESRQKRSVGLSNPFEANEERKVSFFELSELSSFGDSPGLYNQHLSYVNKLRMCWHKGQSAVIIDDQIDQERITKVILYISSLNCNVKRPFLILSTSTGLSTWETEFLNLAPSANLVVYKGTKYVRDSIRALEFYNEDGGSSFQILLSSSDIIIEDLHALRYIQWEAIIIDECHRPRILGQFDNLDILKAETRLLLISGQIKEDRTDYMKLLSFLKSGHDEIHFSSASISNLKSQLEQYIALKCSSDSSRFIEYWVPAQLSSLQLEQYCSMLLSNSLLLCSGQKSNSVDALHDLIISTRKCCNHPYLLNPSLGSLATEGLPVEEHLDIGIKASGKLQLLENILVEAKSRDLRVMILYQSSGGSGSIGNILDDVLCQRFGNDCYVRYGRGYIPSKKQAALAAFNDRKSGQFVFLIESSACVPSIKLSSVDTIILFDSGLDPQSDLKCLQKMSVSSKFNKLTVLRLYSYFTVEEKVLMLAKDGLALDSNVQLLSQSTNHSLLKWGASYLFSKLDDLHGSGTSVSALDISDHSILNGVIFELSSKLGCDSKGTDCHGQSFVSRVQQNGGEYERNISLLGEREMKKLGNETHTLSWSDLLKGRNPHWRFLPVLPQSIRKRIEYFHHSLAESEKDTVDPEERKVTKDSVDPKRRKVSKDIVGTKRREFSKSVADPKTGKVAKEIVDSNRSKVSVDIVGSKHVKKKWKNKNRSPGERKRKLNGVSVMNKPIKKQKERPDMPKSTKLLSKPAISDLCDVLHIPENVKAVAMRLLEYVFEHYNVRCLEVSIVQAFEISVCWLAASLLKHEIDRKHSLDLAKQHLNFNCKEEEATYVYNKLQKHEKDFSNCLQNELCVEKDNTHIGPGSLTPELKDLVEDEKQKGFQHPHVLNLVKSATHEADLPINSPTNEADLPRNFPTNEADLPRKSPTTVLFSQNQIYTENFHEEPYIAHEIATSQKNPGSFPMKLEADATSMECVPDEGINSINLVAAEVSSLEHWNEFPNLSNDFNNVNHVSGSLERQSPIVSSDIPQCDDSFFEDLPILMNQVIDIDNSMNMSTHPAQLLNVEIDTVTCDRTAVPEVIQPYSVVTPICGESTSSEFSEWPLPYTQLSLADLVAFSQTSQPTSEAPENENFTCAPHDITNPGYINSDHFQAHYGPFEMPIEMPHDDADSLLIEMEQIIKKKEEAYKACEEKILQLQSDYTMEYEMLREKYNMLLQNVDTSVALKHEDLETQRNIVSKSMVLADLWSRNYNSCFYSNLQQNVHNIETSIYDSPYHPYACSMTPSVYGNIHL